MKELYHKGEIAVQQKVGVEAMASSVGRIISDKIHKRVNGFIEEQPLTIADSLGNFRIEYLEPNKKYVIEISAFGYGKQKFDIQTKNGINSVTFELKADCEYNAERAESDWKNGKANFLLCYYQI